MSWLSKLFSKNSETISQPKKLKRSNSTRSRTNRNRSGSLVMQKKMQKKIAESAKERVLDKRRGRKAQSVLDFKLDKDCDSVDNARFDINKNEIINSNLMIKEEYYSEDSKDEQSNSVNLNGYERTKASTKEQSSVEENDQSVNSKSADEENRRFGDASNCKIASKKEICCLEQPELFSYRALHSPNNFKQDHLDKQETKNNKEMSVDQMRLTDHHHPKTSIHKTMSEDSCAINELIEGRMDLQVIVPFYLIKNQPSSPTSTVLVLINVERKTPMLDLLIQIGNKIKFNVNDYKINVIDELRNVTYKASTPIGSLDCNQIQIVPKTSAAIALDKMKLRELEFANQKNQHKSISTFNKLVQNTSLNDLNNSHGSNGSSVNASIPFQTTFRVQVNLPHNQRTVFRVKPTTKISEIKEHVCEDRNLNQDKYQLVVFADLKQKQHPQLLEDDRTIAFYAVNELTLISNKNLERMQMQNEINDLNNKFNGKLDNGQTENGHLKNSSLKSIVNSQSTASSVPRKAIISLLSATNQLEANCDYSNNICTRNKCVCNLSSISSPSNLSNNCQKRFAKSESSSCLNRIGRRKKAQAPLPPTIDEQNSLKRSHSNHSLAVNKSPTNSEQQFRIKSQLPSSKIRHNSGSDSSGYHECLSNSPNNHQFGGSMINLSNNSLTISPILQQRLTSTPSSKQFRSNQHLNQHHKKRKAPLPPIAQIQRTVSSAEQKSDSDDNKKEEQNDKENIKSTTNIKIVSTTSSATKSPSATVQVEEEKNRLKNDQNEFKCENNYLNLELRRDDYSNETTINNNKKNLKSSSFKSDSSSGHSSGHSSSNSPELNEKDEIRYENGSSNGENSLEVDGESSQNCNESQSKLAKENSENRFLNSKSPTSVASEPIYTTPRTYFNNQSQGSESTNSFVMLNLEEQMRPSSAPNYCEEDDQIINKANKEIQIQNENSKDSGIFLKDTTVNNNRSTIKTNLVVVNDKDAKDETKQQVKSLDKVKEESENKVDTNNVTTLIINVNDSQERIEDHHHDDIKSISTLIENGDLIIDDQQLSSPTKNDKVMQQANCSTSNIAPPNCALNESKSEEKVSLQDSKLETKTISEEEEEVKPAKDELVSQQSKSRILNIKEQFEQQSTNGLNKPKIKLKLNNFKIGSYSTNQAEEDIYSDRKSIYLPPYQVNLVQKQTSATLSNTVEKSKEEDLKASVKKSENLKEEDYDDEKEEKISKPVSPVKKPIRSSLNAIKFNEVSLNEGLSGSLTKLNNKIKDTDNFNSDEFNDNQEFSSLYLNDNGYNNYTYSDYQPDRTIQNLCSNLSNITPQPYHKPIRTMVPRKLFYPVNQQENTNVNNDLNSNQVSSSAVSKTDATNAFVPEPPSLPKNLIKTNQENKFKVSSIKDDKLKNTINYLVSDQKNLQLNCSKLNTSECHDVLMNEIRSFGGRNSLKKVQKRNEEFEMNF